MATISIIIPCYFNEKNIPVTGRALLANEKLFPKGTRFEYIFIDDGSGDGTLRELMRFQRLHPKNVTVVKLSRNFGSNYASLAGISVAHGDCYVTFAADLQDPPELIPKMFAFWQKGVKLVLANRNVRAETGLSALLSNSYHFLMRRLVFPKAPAGGFDLMLFDRQLKDDILSLKERNFFLPYLLIWLGYAYVTIPYTRRKRAIGTSRWTFAKRLTSFIDSFVSFTFLPLRFISVCGLLLSVLAFAYAVAVVWARLTTGIPVEGWTSLVIILLFVSSFQMIALGVMGEYLWRTLDAARGRPPYIIEKIFKKS